MGRKAESAGKAETAPKLAADPRARVVDALMALAGEMRWADITLNDIATKTEMSLADLRDLFPSKGAMLGGFIRRIDRQMLEHPATDLAAEPARDRVLDLMIRRFDALKPYRTALRNIHRAFQGDLMGLAALNSQALNSWRYLLASADIDTDGPLGYLRLQGVILVFARIFPIFLDDEGEELPRTMAALDRELKRGEWVLRRAEGVQRLISPFQGFCRAARESRREARRPIDPASDAA